MVLMSRRGLLAGAAAAGAQPRWKKRRHAVGMQPDQQGVFFQVVVVGGGSQGVFIYDVSNNLIASVAGVGNVDPLTLSNLPGITAYAPGVSLAIQMTGSGIQAFSGPAGGPYVGQADFVPGLLTGSSFWKANTSLGIGPDVFGNLIFLSPTGVAVDDTANIGAVLSNGGTPFLLPGTWNVNCGDATLTTLGPGQYIQCSGEIATKINAVGSGDLFGWQQTAAYNGFTTIGGGIRGGCTIDMGATTAASNGIHAGDIEGLIFEATVQNATQAGSFGFLFDNRNHFTERMRGDITAKNCDTHVAFTVSGATTSTKSFARPNMDIKITQGASSNGDGVQLLNGAELYDGRLSIRGNFSSSASALTSAVLRVTGSVPVGHPGAGTLSKIDHCQLDIGVEVDSAHANTASTIIYGASGNNIKANGNMDFIGAFTAANLNGGNMVYDGLIDGDTTIGSRFYYGEDAAQSLTANGQTIRASGVAATHPVSATGAVTGIIMGAGAFGGQVIWVFNTGANSITFAASPGSNLASQVGPILNAGGKFQLVWDAASALWY